MKTLESILGLRCPHCGGPLPKSNKKLAECKYCGTTVRIDDATQYLDHLKGFVLQWIKASLPEGINFAYSGSVDPVARHNIFVQNVQPNLNAEFSGLEFDALQLLSTTLGAPPFIAAIFPERQRSAKSLFSFDAKVSSIHPLAVSEEDKKNVQKMEGLTKAFGHIVIALDLMEKNENISYKAIAENFSAAAKALESSYETQSKRMAALAEIYLSVNDLLSKKIEKARKRISRSLSLFKDVKSKTADDINLSICYPAIEEENEVAETVSLLVALVEYDPVTNALDTIRKIENLFEIMSTETNNTTKDWVHIFRNSGRYAEVMKWVCKISEAKKGKPTIRITSGRGQTLFPFWAVNINYTFSTGSLWMRKGKSVKEMTLLAATFPMYSNFVLSPSDVVANIFERKPDGDLLRPLLGRETSISIGEHLRRLTDNATLKSASGYNVVPPMTTASEAQRLMNIYIQRMSNELKGKLYVASIEIFDLIFVPTELTSSSINFHETLGGIPPKTVGNLQKINSVIL